MFAPFWRLGPRSMAQTQPTVCSRDTISVARNSRSDGTPIPTFPPDIGPFVTRDNGGVGERVVHCSTSCYSEFMTTTISQRELRNRSGDIMRGLDEGETYIVTRNGRPVGELSPMRRLRFVAAATVSEAFRDAPSIDADTFRGDLDAPLDQGVDPRV